MLSFGRSQKSSPMPARTIAIGDIHGHSRALAALLDDVKPQPQDTLVFLGDYIDRGPDSRGVTEQVIALQERCQVVPLMGNHEEMLLNARETEYSLRIWLENGGDTAFQSYGITEDLGPDDDFDADALWRAIPEKHLEFLANTLRFHETDSHFFIHSNYAPNWRLEDHDTRTSLWLPLTDLPGPHYSGKTAVLGHTPQLDGRVLDGGHVVCIDTGCGYGGVLTAMDVGSGRIWQVGQNS